VRCSYWEEFVERIRDAPWWNSDEPKEKSEKGVWLGRAAMLDAIFYEGREIKPDEPRKSQLTSGII
jgi:hypothetical protein